MPFAEDANFITIFDQQLTIRNPLEEFPHATDSLGRGNNYLFGPAYIFVEGSDRMKVTRLVHYEGEMYSLREHRRLGTEGRTPALGARIAIENDHPRVDRRATGARIPGSLNFQGAGRYQLHLIDTVIDDWVYLTSVVKLNHLVVTFTAFVDQGDTGSQDQVDVVVKGLDDAARRWSAGHPAAPESAKKAHTIIPKHGPLDMVILVRFFFGHHRQFKPGRMRILLHEEVRANADSTTSTIHIQLSDATGEGLVLPDGDGVTSTRFQMAHEFGHVTGLPDEYLEKTKLSDGLPWFFQVESDGGPARPFVGDRVSLMESARLPRLRHLWHHVFALNHEPSLSGPLGGRTFVSEYWRFASEAYKGPLRYELSAVPPFAAPGDPWMPIARRVMPKKRVELFLYQLGADEAAAGAIAGNSNDLPRSRAHRWRPRSERSSGIPRDRRGAGGSFG